MKKIRYTHQRNHLIPGNVFVTVWWYIQADILMFAQWMNCAKYSTFKSHDQNKYLRCWYFLKVFSPCRCHLRSNVWQICFNLYFVFNNNVKDIVPYSEFYRTLPWVENDIYHFTNEVKKYFGTASALIGVNKLTQIATCSFFVWL